MKNAFIQNYFNLLTEKHAAFSLNKLLFCLIIQKSKFVKKTFMHIYILLVQLLRHMVLIYCLG